MKGRSAQSGAIAWTMLSWSASGIFAICFALTRPTTIRLGRTCRSTRMRRHRALFMPLAALCRRHSSADFTTNMSEFDFRQAQETSVHCKNNPQQTMTSLSTDITGPAGKLRSDSDGNSLRSIGHIGRLQRFLDKHAEDVTPLDMLAELCDDNEQLGARRPRCAAGLR